MLFSTSGCLTFIPTVRKITIEKKKCLCQACFMGHSFSGAWHGCFCEKAHALLFSFPQASKISQEHSVRTASSERGHATSPPATKAGVVGASFAAAAKPKPPGHSASKPSEIRCPTQYLYISENWSLILTDRTNGLCC